VVVLCKKETFPAGIHRFLTFIHRFISPYHTHHRFLCMPWLLDAANEHISCILLDSFPAVCYYRIQDSVKSLSVGTPATGSQHAGRDALTGRLPGVQATCDATCSLYHLNYSFFVFFVPWLYLVCKQPASE
jgi:hypothetical protein